MKKKNLEKAIILGLILSTGVYGTAWAQYEGLRDGQTVSIDDELHLVFEQARKDGGISINDLKQSLQRYKTYIDENGQLQYVWGERYNDKTGEWEKYREQEFVTTYDVYGGNALSIFDEVVITINKDSGDKNGLSLNSVDLVTPETDFKVNVGAEDNILNTLNGVCIQGGDKTNFEINNYTANIYALASDAFQMSSDINAVDKGEIQAAINSDFNAYVYNGSGIRADASLSENMSKKSSVVNVKGDTKIVVDSDLVEDSLRVDYQLEPALADWLVDVKYKPSAVYAGDSMINFDFEGRPIDESIFGMPYNVAEGYYGQETYGQGIINLDGNIEIDTKAYGIYAGKNGAINLNKNNNANLIIKGNGTEAIGIAAINSNLVFSDYIKIHDGNLQWLPYLPFDTFVELTDGNFDTSANKYGSVVTMNGENNTITMENGGKALYADAKNKADGDKDVIIQSGADGIGTLDVKGDIVAANSGKINLQVNDWADITGDIEATNSAEINFTLQPEAMMIVSDTDNNIIGNSGVSTLSLAKNGDAAGGNVQAANGATINFNLGNAAYFEGRVDDYKDADNTNWSTIDRNLFDSAFVTENIDENGKMTSGKVNMTLGNGAVWNVTEQSWVTNLSGNGTVVLVGEVNQNDENLDSNIYTEGTGGYAVHIGKLEGNNTFVVNLNPDNYASSDMIYIYDGSSAGVQNLRINNEQEVLNALQNDGDRIRFATAAKTATTEGAGFGDDYVVRGRGVINSGFSIDYVDYATDTDNGNYNGTAGAVKPGDEYIENTYGAVADSQNLYLVRDSSKDAGLSDSGKTVINMSRANYKNAVYMDRLNKRLGEARYFNNEEEQGMWVRLRHDRIGLDGEFRSQNTMYEMGYDVKQDCDNGERRVGMAIDYMDGSTSYSNIIGEGETKRYGLWLYDTWLGDKGHYTDYVLKWGHLDNDFDIRDKDSLVDITGDYSNNVFSASAEYGKKNDMGGGWYFEPQAQLQFARVTGADYVTSQDSKVSLDGINSLIGRAGFRLGRDLNENSTVYIKADLLHEFLGDQDITATDITGTLREEYENEGTWYDVGFGFATAMGKNSYAFMDFEKSFGNDNDETYQINAGVQWTF